MYFSDTINNIGIYAEYISQRSNVRPISPFTYQIQRVGTKTSFGSRVLNLEIETWLNKVILSIVHSQCRST